MKRHSSLLKKIITTLFVVVGIFVLIPKQASAVQISGLGSAIIGCSGIGNTLSDMITELGKDDAFNTLGGKSVPGVATPGAVKTQEDTLRKELDSVKNSLARQERKANCLDGIAYAAAKNTLANITQRTVNWANTGFNGNPLFVRDAKSYFKDLENQQLKYFLSDLADINNPYIIDIKRGLVSAQQYTLQKGLESTFKKDTGLTQKQFETNFSSGGWSAYNSYNLNPANNPLGSQLIAQEALEKKKTEAKEGAQDELLWNNGFLSIKKCDNTQPRGNRPCQTFTTETPGSIIKDQLSLVLGTPIRQLENADSVNEALGAVFDSLVNNFFNKGLAALGKAQEKAGYGNSDSFLQGDQYAGSNSNVTIDLLGSDGGDPNNLFAYNTSWFGINGDFDIRSKTQFDAVIKAQHDYITALNDSRPFLDKIVLPVAVLDMCVPGPNPAWEPEVKEKVQELGDAIASNSYTNPAPGQVNLPKWFTGTTQVIDAVSFGMITQVANGIIHIFGGKTADELLADKNDQNQTNYAAKLTEYSANQTKIAQGLGIAYNDYYTKINAAYSQNAVEQFFSNSLGANLGASAMVSSLRNYDNNISELKDIYFTRKQETELNITRLNMLWAQIGPIVGRGRQRAMIWNRMYCPTAITTDSGNGIPTTGPSGGTTTGTDGGSGNPATGPSGGTTAGAGTGTTAGAVGATGGAVGNTTSGL